jgi:hypothetical protein
VNLVVAGLVAEVWFILSKRMWSSRQLQIGALRATRSQDESEEAGSGGVAVSTQKLVESEQPTS